jgi:hypothetical protein
MSEDKSEYGYDLIHFDGIEVPTFTFGGGNITVAAAFGDSDGFSGVVLSEAPEATEVGDYVNQDKAGKAFTEIPNLNCYMRFDNTKSIDILIAKLSDAKAHMKAIGK